MKKWDSILNKIPSWCHILETLMALAVFIGFIFALWNYFVVQGVMGALLTGEVTFSKYLEIVLSLVIGIEFLKMFCAPGAEHVIEVLIFMVARHMVVSECKPLEIFILVAAVCLLCIVRVYLHKKEKEEKEEIKKHAVNSPAEESQGAASK